MERLVPHRTRVVVEGRGAGMVVRVDNVRRKTTNGGRGRVEVPAQVHVVLDVGGRAIVEPNQVTVGDLAA